MTLTDLQKQLVIDTYKSTSDLNEITRRVFDNNSIDGRSKEGRLIRQFMIENKLKFKTARRVKKEGIEFTEEQIDFIIKQGNDGLSSLKIAEIVFPKKEVKPLSLEQRAVLEILREANPDYTPSQDVDASLSSYVAPKSTGRIVKRLTMPLDCL